MRPVFRIFFRLSFLSIFVGCGLGTMAPPSPVTGAALRGNVHGGQQPVVGAHVYLFSAGLSGYGGSGIPASSANASLSLLNPDKTAHSDSVGAYVLSDSGGGFTITGDYVCTPGTQVYALALGGNPGSGANSAIGLMTVLGNCPAGQNFLSATPFVMINEVSTVAAAYSLAGFATDPTHIASSGSSSAKAGIANAAANAAVLVDIASGTALLTTPDGSGTNPQAKINTIADVLAGCVNSTGPSSQTCFTLFSNALSNGTSGTTPTDTATALINIAHNPGANVSALAALYATVAATAPFLPTLTTAPTDLTLATRFTVGTGSILSVAVDSTGNIWAADNVNNKLFKLSNSGALLSGTTGYAAGKLNQPYQIAVDTSDNVWVGNQGSNNLIEVSNSGSVLSGANGFTGGGLTTPTGIAIDPFGDVWVSNSFSTSSSLSEFSSSGVPLSPNPSAQNSSGGYYLPLFKVNQFAFDSAGYAWFPNQGGDFVTKLSAFVSANAAGQITSGASTFPLSNQGHPLFGPAIDSSQNVWIAGGAGESVFEMSNTGGVLSGAAGFSGGGLAYPLRLSIDGSNHIWVADDDYLMSEFSNNGSPISGTSGFNGNASGNPMCFPADIAVDSSGNVWEAAGPWLCKVVGAATPVVTPIAQGVKQNTLGTKP